jgi:hypothetical protein
MRHGQALAGAVVATDSVSADADCDNGAVFQSTPRLRGRDEPATRCLDVRPVGEVPGIALYRLRVGARKLGQRRAWRSEYCFPETMWI